MVLLVFQLGLLGLVLQIRRENAEAQRWATHTKEVLTTGQTVLTGLSDVQAGARGYAFSRDPAFLAPAVNAGRELPETLRRLIELVQDNPGQSARAAAAADQALKYLAWSTEVVDAIRHDPHAPAADRAAERVRAGEGIREIDPLRREIGEFLAEEQRLDRDRTAALEDAQLWSRWAMAGAGVASFLFLGLATVVFSRGISRRFAVLTDNTRRLAAREELNPPLGGRDEIARLDLAFRDMATELGRSRETLRKSSDEIRDLFDNAPCGYHSVDAEGTVIAMNRTELRWLGYSEAEVIGSMRFADVLSSANREVYWKTFARVREYGAAADVELELVRKDGSTFPVLLNSSAVRDSDGRFLRSRTTLTDLTERKRAEDEVRRFNDELEERVRHRTAELAEANRDLAHKNAENEMFVYSVSHDLRSPLVNLQGFSKELEKGCRALVALLSDVSLPGEVREPGLALLDGKMAKSVGFIQSAVMRLSGIIDALLRLSRVGRVEYRRETVDVSRVIARVFESMQGTIAERGATVTAGDLPPVSGDPTAVEQVFANLVGNALTYLDAARPGQIEVGCHSAEADGAPAGFRTYYVRDNGLGIAEAHRTKIFQAFQRAHPSVAKGEGLGLAIVSRVAERHRGRVWVESAVGQGSTFYVTLPASA